MRLVVRGESFMLNQIRNMAGAAVAVARGLMSLELLSVALAAPGRVTVPRAPPHTLLLAGSDFGAFARAYGDQPAPELARLTGDCLTLRAGGAAAQEAFRREVLYPAVSELLKHPDWAWWRDTALPRYRYDAGDVAAAVARHQAWLDALLAKRAEAAAARRAEKEEGQAAGKEEQAGGGSSAGGE